ncbi:MAG: hypothetical protein KJZ93_32785 [Caldilineaceae bacterium]|nr:hypothetical protein [Caldilineaceae bacterium]
MLLIDTWRHLTPPTMRRWILAFYDGSPAQPPVQEYCTQLHTPPAQ